MEIVTFGTVDCADFLDARQRRRVWGGTLEGRLAALERHLGGPAVLRCAVMYCGERGEGRRRWSAAWVCELG